MTSNSGAMRITSSNMAMWCARWSTDFLLSRREVFDPGMSLAEVCESPLANKVTSWPCATSCSVRNETTRSVPPYILGGTLSYRGETCAIFTGASRWANHTHQHCKCKLFSDSRVSSEYSRAD